MIHDTSRLRARGHFHASARARDALCEQFGPAYADGPLTPTTDGRGFFTGADGQAHVLHPDALNALEGGRHG